MYTHALNRERLMKLLGPPNCFDAERLASKIYVPLCPLGSSVFRYENTYGRVIRYRINEIKFTEDGCIYDAECYENDSMIDFKAFNEKEIGARFFLSRSSAKRNAAYIEPEDAKVITAATKACCKATLKFKYLSKTGEGYFVNLNTGCGMGLISGLKYLASLDSSNETQSSIQRIVSKSKSTI